MAHTWIYQQDRAERAEKANTEQTDEHR
jgi:hypothetical protein